MAWCVWCDCRVRCVRIETLIMFDVFKKIMHKDGTKITKQDAHRHISNLKVDWAKKGDMHKEIQKISNDDWDKISSEIDDIIKFVEKRLQQFDENVNKHVEDMSKKIEEGRDVTPRQIAESITDGDREPQHIGKYTEEMLSQEITAMGQTNLSFRDKKWLKRADYLQRVLTEKIKENPKLYQGMLRKLHDIVQGEL